MRTCPICDEDAVVPGEMVDIGVGSIKSAGDYCEACGWEEPSPHDGNALPVEEQRRRHQSGWTYAPLRCGEPAPEHAEWVRRHVGDNPLGECWERCAEMRDAFPELICVYGTACTLWGNRAHVVLHTPDGLIVDPTCAQYPGGAVFAFSVAYPVDPRTRRRTDWP